MEKTDEPSDDRLSGSSSVTWGVQVTWEVQAQVDCVGQGALMDFGQPEIWATLLLMHALQHRVFVVWP
jgi:hypothetical protein